MPKKTENEKGTNRINQGYVPSDYAHVQSVLDAKAEEMLERTYGPNWKDLLNEHAEDHKNKENAET